MKRFIVIVLAVAAVGAFLVIRYYPFSNIIPLGPRQTAADARGEVSPQPDAPQRRQRLRPSPASEDPASVVETTPEPEPQEMTATTEPDEIADEQLAAARVTQEPEPQEIAATTDEPDEVADEQLTAAQSADEPEPIATTELDESASEPLAAAETTQEPEPRENAAATAPDESDRNLAATDTTETEDPAGPDNLARSPHGSTVVVGSPGAPFQLGAGDRLGEVIFNRYAAMVRAKAGKVRYAAEQP